MALLGAAPGCGGGDEPTTTALTPEEAVQHDAMQTALDTDLCSEVASGEGDLNEDGQCRERPTCQEVADGAELPEDGVCLDVESDEP